MPRSARLRKSSMSLCPIRSAAATSISRKRGSIGCAAPAITAASRRWRKRSRFTSRVFSTTPIASANGTTGSDVGFRRAIACDNEPDRALRRRSHARRIRLWRGDADGHLARLQRDLAGQSRSRRPTVTVVAGSSTIAGVARQWRDPAAWLATVDVLAILTAASLPWSTSLPAIFAAAMLVAMVPFLDVQAYLQSLKRPICAVPIAFFLLALAGTTWSDAPWGVRFYAVGATVKLLMLPVLFYHFERSARVVHVLTGFLVSSALLMAMSFIVAFDPSLALRSGTAY